MKSPRTVYATATAVHMEIAEELRFIFSILALLPSRSSLTIDEIMGRSDMYGGSNCEQPIRYEKCMCMHVYSTYITIYMVYV